METIYYEEIDSTNNEAKRLLDRGKTGHTVLVAARQSAGRGRLGRAFHSPDGGIYMSILLPWQKGPELLHLVTPAAAVGTARAIEAVCGIDCRIKWVNDLLLNGKKVCGILTEQYKGAVVIGIGVNDTPPPGGFPAQLADIVTSLAGPGEPGFRQGLIPAIAGEVSRLIEALPDAAFLTEYRARSCVLGKSITVHRGEERFDAVAQAIDDSCRLICRRPDGQQVILASGEVQMTVNS